MTPFTINETIRMKPLKQDLTWTEASRLVELGLGSGMRHSLNFRTPFGLSPKSGSVNVLLRLPEEASTDCQC